MYWSSALACVTPSTMKKFEFRCKESSCKSQNCMSRSKSKLSSLLHVACWVACCMHDKLYACMSCACWGVRMHSQGWVTCWVGITCSAMSRASCNWSVKSRSKLELKCKAKLCLACNKVSNSSPLLHLSTPLLAEVDPSFYTVLCSVRVKEKEVASGFI